MVFLYQQAAGFLTRKSSRAIAFPAFASGCPFSTQTARSLHTVTRSYRPFTCFPIIRTTQGSTAPNAFLYSIFCIISHRWKMRNHFLLLGHRFLHFAVPSDDLPIAFPAVGVETAAAILAAIGTDHKVAAAPGPQQIEGTPAEKTVEVLRVRSRVAGEIFTLAVGEIGVFFIRSQAPQSFTEK